MSFKIPTKDTPVDAECAGCKHSPAYHDGQEDDARPSRPCRAWDPDQLDAKCACPGWKEKTAPETVGAKPWGHERADLQGE